MMPGPGKKIKSTIGVSGSHNFIQVARDMITIGEQNIYQTVSPSISSRETSIWFKVRKPVSSFTGRRRELKNLHEAVQRNQEKNEHKLTVISQVISISGLGGIGKSELARMYAHEYGHNYDGNVMWINAETYETLTESFHRLAKDKLNISTKSIDGQEKDIISIVEEVYNYFSKRRSLFIFDNVEKWKTDNKENDGIDQFLPHNQPIGDHEPYIIITSRNQKWGKSIKVIPIDAFTEEEAIEFIKKELDASDESLGKEIKELAKTLQYFPLALQQAVAYIKHEDEELKDVFKEKFGIVDYIKSYHENARELLNYQFPKYSDNCYIKTTFITWEVTVEKIKQNKYGNQALEVLETIAYFSPDDIPTKTFLKLVNGEKEVMRSMLQLLAQFSMINLEYGVINIHRLVQQVTRLRLKEKKYEEETLRKAINLIKTQIEEGNADSSKYTTHAISAWNYASNDENIISKHELIELSSQITYKLIEDTRYQEAYAFAIRTLETLNSKVEKVHLSTLNIEYSMAQALSNRGRNEIFHEISKQTELVLGAEHPSNLLAKCNIATLYWVKGKYDEALEIYQDVFNIQERALGEKHPSTLATRNQMADALYCQGKYDEALGIYRENLIIQESVLGREHPSTSKTRNQIANVLYSQGKYDEALGIYREVFNIRESILGGEHPITLLTKHEMANVLYSQGKYDESLGIYQVVFNIRERILGREHPSTLATRHCIALVLDRQGKYDEALAIYRDVFNIRKRVLGGEHQSTLTTRHCIALVLDSQGKYDQALEIHRDVFNIRKRVSGGEHPSVLTTRHCIALVLDRQGKYDEALGIYQEVFNIRKRVLGGEHPSSLTTRYCIALVLDSQGKYDEALEIHREVYNIRERVLGSEHPYTLTSRYQIANALYRQGKYDEALEICRKVFNIQERVLGEKNSSTLKTRHQMANALYGQGKYEEALRIYQEVFINQECVLGGEHPSTLTTRNQIADVLYCQGNYDQALGIYQEVFNIQKRILGGEHPSTLKTRHIMSSINQRKYTLFRPFFGIIFKLKNIF